MTMGQGIILGPFHLPVYRMLLAVGFLRVVFRGEWLGNSLNTIDKTMVLWGGWVLFASLFHDASLAAAGVGVGPIYTLGIIFNIVGVYFLVRAWCRSYDELTDVIKLTGLVLAPVALEMIYEKLRGHNLFSVFGGVPVEVAVRGGKLRAQGPFRHAILAGTVGATFLPLAIGSWKQHRGAVSIGIAASIVMVFTSASSGPFLSMLAGLGAVATWFVRGSTSLMRRLAVVFYLFLEMVMNKPPYYLIARVDVTGSSTGYHRALLIDQTIRHFSEWFLFGTDRTRHWMLSQGAINAYQTDITNYYIGFAVLGGLVSLILFIKVLWTAFLWIGKIIQLRGNRSTDTNFELWCFGAGLFSHAVTSISVAYFDQSLVFFWLNVAVISSTFSTVLQSESPPDVDLGGEAALEQEEYASAVHNSHITSF